MDGWIDKWRPSVASSRATFRYCERTSDWSQWIVLQRLKYCETDYRGLLAKYQQISLARFTVLCSFFSYYPIISRRMPTSLLNNSQGRPRSTALISHAEDPLFVFHRRNPAVCGRIDLLIICQLPSLEAGNCFTAILCRSNGMKRFCDINNFTPTSVSHHSHAVRF